MTRFFEPIAGPSCQAVKESKAPAISRAAAVLRLLGKHDTPLGLQPIAAS
jgi:hypothetical protein